MKDKASKLNSGCEGELWCHKACFVSLKTIYSQVIIIIRMYEAHNTTRKHKNAFVNLKPKQPFCHERNREIERER